MPGVDVGGAAALRLTQGFLTTLALLPEGTALRFTSADRSVL